MGLVLSLMCRGLFFLILCLRFFLDMRFIMLCLRSWICLLMGIFLWILDIFILKEKVVYLLGMCCCLGDFRLC